MIAHSYLSETLVILLTVYSVVIFGAKAQQISTACTSSAISTFTPCLNYITGSSSGGTGSSPTKDCCDSLKSLMTNNMDCVCLIVTGNVPVSIPFVNSNLAISLPRVCQNSVPLQCKASGIPLPAPGPVLFGPPPPPTTAPSSPPHAPSPDHSHSPKASKAEAAVAAPPSTGSLNIPSVTPPNFPMGPSSNRRIRPVVNPNNSASTLSMMSLPSLFLMLMAIVTF